MPLGLDPKVKFNMNIRFAEVPVMPGLYHSLRQWERLSISTVRRRQNMPIRSRNMTVEEVVGHLASIGTSDEAVREGHHYAVSWLTTTAASPHLSSDERSAASAILARLRQVSTLSEDAPLMNEPRWWFPDPDDMALRVPHKKRKREGAPSGRGGAPIYPGHPRPDDTTSTLP